jgi:hypothetical protein
MIETFIIYFSYAEEEQPNLNEPKNLTEVLQSNTKQ